MPTRLARAIDRPVARYVWAVALVVSAFLLRQAIIKTFGVPFPAFITFYPAVMLAALLGGLWSGVLATTLAAMLAVYWIFPPVGSFALADKTNLVTFVFFVGTGIFLSLVAERYRQGQKQVAIHKEQQARREADDKLRQTEEQFEALANSIPQLCWMADPDGWIFWYNQRWYAYTGTTREEMQGWAWQSVHNPDTLPKVLEQWKTSLATATPFEMILPLKGRDGEFRSFLTRGVPVKDAGGNVVRWFGTNTDVDEQMRIEAELRNTNSRLDLALEVAGMGEWELDLKTHDASRSLRHGQIFGYEAPLPKWTYEMFLDHVVPQHKAEIQTKFDASLASGVWDFETQIKRTDGGVRWIWARGRWVLDDKGKPVRTYGIVMDITERKQAEEAQAADKAKLDAALASMTDAVLISDISGQFIQFNDAFAAFCRFSDKAECSTKLSELRKVLEIRTLDGELVPLDSRPIPRSLRGETDMNVEYNLTRTDTGETWVGSYTFNPIRDSVGEILGSVMVVRDITERKRIEDQLRRSTALHNQLLGSMDEGFCLIQMMFDPENKPVDWRFIEVNAAFEQQSGWRDVVGKRLREISPNHQQFWLDFQGNVALTGEPGYIYESPGLNGFYEVHAYRVGEPEERQVAVLFNDITERKRAEENIQKLNRTYALLSDINQTIVREKDSQAMLEAACRIAVEKGKFRMAWVGMFNPDTQGLEPIASAATTDEDLDLHKINSLDPAKTGQPWARSFRSGQHDISNDIESDPLSLSWRHEALRHGFRSSAAFPLGVDSRTVGVFTLYASEPGFFDDEELVLLDELAMDISFALEVNRHEEDRRKTEEELRWRTAFFEAQVESALDGIMVVDRQGEIILKNKRVNELWKVPSEVASKDYSAQVQFVVSVTKNPDQFVEKMEYLFAHPDEVSQDEIELLDGTLLDRYSSPVKDKAGTYFGRIWIFHDITSRRRLEEQLRQSQKMEAVGQLSGGIAHDFNNLLGVIIGNLDLMERRVSEDAVTVRRVQTARKAAQRGADLTRRLLAFSSNVGLKPSPTDLHLCVRNMIELSRAVGSDLSFATNFDDSIPPVLVDAAGLETALLNLVVNARDAMPNGGTITVSTQMTRLEENYPPVRAGELKADRYACISVSDTGSGMSKETLDRVFEPFFTTKPQGKGTGLGLAMVYGFVKQSGGSVRIYSELGVGTTVTFYLPLAVGDVQSVPAAHLTASPGPRGGKVLVVDDEFDLVDIATAYLEEMGYTAYRAEDGASALAIAGQNRDIDLVITDIIMPGGMNGVELAQKIRQLLPQIKVIYSSGFPANTLAERSMQLFDGPLLRKPYQRAEFEAAVHLALGETMQ